MTDISDHARAAGEAFAGLVATVERLRSPGGCPWDADQTHDSLRQHLLEECYELLDAIDSRDSDGIEEEIGDVLTQLVFHADIARREARFDAASVSNGVRDKLIRRHPHVFADSETLTDASEVVERWEALKRSESGRTSAVSSLPSALPALALAGSVQRRAITAGLKWPETANSAPLFERGDDETDDEAEERAGEVLMHAALEIRQANIDPEIALHRAATALRNRVLRTESMAGGTPLADLEPGERESVWRRSTDR